MFYIPTKRLVGINEDGVEIWEDFIVEVRESDDDPLLLGEKLEQP